MIRTVLKTIQNAILKTTVRTLASLVLVLLASQAWAQSGVGPCPRFSPGSVVLPPPDVFSGNGALNVQLNYYTTVDQDGRSLFCFQTPAGQEDPTLRLNPGDQLNILASNEVPVGTPVEQVSNALNQCGDLEMYTSSMNIHYHGTTSAPTCHQDQVIHTIINSYERFQYNVQLPNYIPSGLYWYRPHVHGISEATVQGGASGALIISGIQNYEPEVAGLPERVLLIRDEPVAGNANPGDTCDGNNNVTPSWDLAINYVPLEFQPATCTYTPAIIELQAGGREFWRVSNSGADTILDIQLQYDGVPQPLQLAALDGVAINSQNGQQQGSTETVTDILLAPAARAEFIVTGPQAGQHASFVTLNIDTGPDGDVDPTRTIATIKTDAPTQLPVIPAVTQSMPAPMPAAKKLANLTPTVHRTLYFSEVLEDPSNPNSPTNFFITIDGATPVLFDPNYPPAIITHQGAIEDWTIQNRALENHEFHMHQIHFLVESQSGFSVPQEIGQFLDMVQVPYWSGSGPYPSVTVRMDFRGADVGDFVYHCHILGHEDSGMMAIIRVLPSLRVAHDFNNDGKSDVLWRDTTGDVAMWLMNGGQVLQTGSLGNIPTAWSVIGQRDFTGAGYADLLWRDTTGDLSMWFMNGITVSSAASLGNVATVWTVKGTGDLNGDGDGDLLWQDSSGDVVVWYMNGSTVSSTGSLGNVPTNWSIVGDDSIGNIYWRDSAGDLAIWQVSGGQVTASSGLGNVASNWQIAGLGDFDGDGVTDILFRDTSSGTVAIWFLNPGGQVQSTASLGAVPSNWSIAIWFMNGAQVSSTANLGNVGTSWAVQSLAAE